MQVQFGLEKPKFKQGGQVVVDELDVLLLLLLKVLVDELLAVLVVVDEADVVLDEVELEVEPLDVELDDELEELEEEDDELEEDEDDVLVLVVEVALGHLPHRMGQ